MYDLLELHSIVANEAYNNNLTKADADQIYANMFKEQVNDLILDIYDSLTEGTITSDEASVYFDIATEAVKGDKLSSKDKNKIDGELSNLPENERKAVEDSIKKASKESSKNGLANKIETLTGIDKVLKSKKTKKAEKEIKESMEDDFDLDFEIAMLESEETGDNARYKKILFDLSKMYKKDVTNIRHAITRANFTEAKNLIVDAKKTLDKIESEISSIPSSASASVLSIAANTVKNGLTATAAIGTGLTVYAGTTGPLDKHDVKTIAAVSTIGGTALGLLDSVSKAVSAKSNTNEFNLYKDKIVKAIDKERDMLDDYEDIVDIANKAIYAGKAVGKDVLKRIDNASNKKKDKKDKSSNTTTSKDVNVNITTN